MCHTCSKVCYPSVLCLYPLALPLSVITLLFGSDHCHKINKRTAVFNKPTRRWGLPTQFSATIAASTVNTKNQHRATTCDFYTHVGILQHFMTCCCASSTKHPGRESLFSCVRELTWRRRRAVPWWGWAGDWTQRCRTHGRPLLPVGYPSRWRCWQHRERTPRCAMPGCRTTPAEVEKRLNYGWHGRGWYTDYKLQSWRDHLPHEVSAILHLVLFIFWKLFLKYTIFWKYINQRQTLLLQYFSPLFPLTTSPFIWFAFFYPWCIALCSTF